jgi:hypothetical protein
MYVYCIEMCIYCLYIFYRCICPVVVESYTIEAEVASPLTPRKYIVLKGNFVFHLRDFDLRFEERNPGVRRELPNTRATE